MKYSAKKKTSAKLKISKTLSGRKLPNNHKNNIKKGIIRKVKKGVESHMYKDSSWLENRVQYSSLFTKAFRLKIYKRDKYKCAICKQSTQVLHCHHKDYNKYNNSLDNMITLCHSCHFKTNFDKEKWKKFFKVKHKIYSLFIGRFQCLPLHRGHIKLINTV